MFAYQDSWSRVVLMYRLQAMVPIRRALILVDASTYAKTERGRDLPAGFEVHCGCDGLAPGTDDGDGYDLVALHYALDDLLLHASGLPLSVRRRQALAACKRLLRPGGMLMGCAAHGWLRPEVSPGSGRRLTVGACTDALAGAGLSNIRCHLLLPSANAPRSIVSLRASPQRYFQHERLARLQGGLSGMSRGVRSWLIQLGLLHLIQGDILFAGQAQ